MRRVLLCLAAALVLGGCGARTDGVIPEKPPAAAEEPPAPLPEEEEAPPEVPEETPPEVPEETPEDWEFVRAADYIPGLAVELRYASEDNFTGQAIYDFTEAYLRYGTAVKLAAVQAALAEDGLGLKIWDAFRPAQAQFRLWALCPDGRYVANPHRGFSSHTRGNTVDLTLVDSGGNELEMPSGFDEFSSKADRDYRDVSPEAAENARRLEEAMTAGGFTPYAGEWWHFTDTESYDPAETFQPPSE